MSTQKQTTVPYAVRDYTRNEEIFNSEIAPRMKKLLNLNQWGNDDIELMKEKWERQNTLMDELKQQCKKARAMTGRIVKFQHADSHAFYLVTKVNKTKCTLEWIDYMDGWVDERLGYKGSLDIDFVHDQIVKEDKLDKLFS